MHKVILADNQDVFRIGLARLLANESELRIVAHASDPAKLHSAIGSHAEALVIVSTSLIADIAAFISRARERACRALVVLRDAESADTYRSTGVAGVISRNVPIPDFIHCVRQIVRGHEFASPPSPSLEDGVGKRAATGLLTSEKRVIVLLMEGLKNRGIAERLGIREQVVKNHLQSIFDKTGCSSRVELALFVAHHPGFAAALAHA